MATPKSRAGTLYNCVAATPKSRIGGFYGNKSVDKAGYKTRNKRPIARCVICLSLYLIANYFLLRTYPYQPGEVLHDYVSHQHTQVVLA